MLARVQVRQKEQEELDRMLKRFKPKMKQLDAMRVRVTMGDEKSALEFLREVRESLELPESIKAKLEVCCCCQKCDPSGGGLVFESPLPHTLSTL